MVPASIQIHDKAEIGIHRFRYERAALNSRPGVIFDNAKCDSIGRNNYTIVKGECRLQI